MNVGEIKTRVYRTFGDEAQVQITDADLLRWINDGMMEITTQNESVLQTVDLQNSVSGTSDYLLPTDQHIIRTIRYKANGDLSYRKLKAMSPQEMDELLDGFDGTEYPNGIPLVFNKYAGYVTLFPTPDYSGTDNIKILYSRYPFAVTADIDVPGIPLSYHNALVSYCLQQAYMLDEDYQAAGNVGSMFTASLRDLKTRENMGAQEFYPVMTTLDEDAW